MIKFLLSRLLQGILIILGIVTLLFTIFFVLGDPAEYMVDESATEETKVQIRKKYGLDKSLIVQYGNYLHNLSPIGMSEGKFGLKSPDLGRSFQTNLKVTEMIGNKIEGTLVLALAAMAFAAILGIFLGVLAALRHDTWLDSAILSGSVLGISAPSFFVGVLIAWIFAVKLRMMTGLNATGYLYEENIFEPGRHLVLKNLLLPALALGIRPLAVFIQLTRSSMLDVLKSDYIRTAHAKGLRPVIVLVRHALRNALNPVLTSVTGWLASLLAGAFFIEYIFNWQGIGKLTIDALNTNDFPVILGCAMFIGTIFVGVSILTDFLYSLLDPRVELDG